MKYTMTLMALGLSAALLTGCGSSNDDGTTGASANINPSGIQGTGPGNTLKLLKMQRLVFWVRGKEHVKYDDFDGESELNEVTFRADNTLTFKETKYPTKDCSGDSTEEDSFEEEYKIGTKTVGSDGKTAFEFDTFGEENGEKYREYFMVRYTSTELFFSDEKEDDSQPNGETPETRNDYFPADGGRGGFTKKK